MESLAMWSSLVGLIFLALALSSFFLKRVLILGIPNFILEAIGLALIFFAYGIMGKVFMLYVAAIVIILAMIFDPFVWKKQELFKKEETKKETKKFSVALNGALGIVMVIFYTLGAIII